MVRKGLPWKDLQENHLLQVTDLPTSASMDVTWRQSLPASPGGSGFPPLPRPGPQRAGAAYPCARRAALGGGGVLLSFKSNPANLHLPKTLKGNSRVKRQPCRQ